MTGNPQNSQETSTDSVKNPKLLISSLYSSTQNDDVELDKDSYKGLPDKAKLEKLVMAQFLSNRSSYANDAAHDFAKIKGTSESILAAKPSEAPSSRELPRLLYPDASWIPADTGAARLILAYFREYNIPRLLPGTSNGPGLVLPSPASTSFRGAQHEQKYWTRGDRYSDPSGLSPTKAMLQRPPSPATTLFMSSPNAAASRNLPPRSMSAADFASSLGQLANTSSAPKLQDLFESAKALQFLTGRISGNELEEASKLLERSKTLSYEILSGSSVNQTPLPKRQLSVPQEIEELRHSEYVEKLGRLRVDRRRERNRLAAKRSREKKANYLTELQDYTKSLETENASLQVRISLLRSFLLGLNSILSLESPTAIDPQKFAKLKKSLQKALEEEAKAATISEKNECKSCQIHEYLAYDLDFAAIMKQSIADIFGSNDEVAPEFGG